MVDRPVVRWEGRLLFGVVLLTLGVVFTLDNLDIVDAEPILRWWPLVLIAIGISKLLGIGTRRHLVWGGMFTVFGIIWLGEALGGLDINVGRLWPVALIFVGGSLLARGIRARPGGSMGASDPEAGAEVRSLAIMSGVVRRVSSQEFRGGELSAMMGGVELDLRGAKPAGGRAVIEVFVLWGGIDVRVSEGWTVVNEGLAIMGAIEDNTRGTGDGRQVLVVKGLVMMGGVEIKN